MASAKILLQAKVKRLGYAPDQYRNLSEAELQKIIDGAIKPGDKSTASTKGSTKGSANGATKGSAATKGLSTAAKGSTAKKGSASTSAPATSEKQKSAAKKGTAAKGKAKRPTAAAGKGSAKSKTAKGSKTAQVKTKGTAKKTTTAKQPARKPASKGTRSRKPVEGRAVLQRDKIDWTVDSPVGATPGKRMDVMKKLRQFEGDSAKVFKSLRAKATTYYPNKTEHEAERMLVWLINRVAYDFAYKSGQHQQGTRAAYGTSEAAQDIRRRQQREEQRKAQEKAERARKRAKNAKAATKGSKKKTTAAKKTGPSKPRGAGKAGQRTKAGSSKR